MSLIQAFMPEIEQIQDDKIREFVAEALAKLPEFYDTLNTYISETKKAMEYSESFLNVLGASDYVRDIIKSSILLQDITRYYLYNDEDEVTIIKEDPMHPLNVRITVSPLLGIVGSDKFDDIMRTIESSHGLSSPIPHVVPSLEDPVHIWVLPFVNNLARAYKG